MLACNSWESFCLGLRPKCSFVGCKNADAFSINLLFVVKRCSHYQIDFFNFFPLKVCNRRIVQLTGAVGSGGTLELQKKTALTGMVRGQ